MSVSGLAWAITLVLLLAMLVIDLLIVGRRPHEPSMRESALWVAVYVGLAVLFGIGMFFWHGSRFAGEFFAGWLTEYSLSVDNLFVFMIIMSRFAVPRVYQQKVLLAGIVIALIMRGAFIAVGGTLINEFVWVFYIFGAFLIYTAIKLARGGENDESNFKENALIRVTRRFLREDQPTGTRNSTMTRSATIIVMIAIGTTDLIFALDSIPAIFGLTKSTYIVFTANVFALMGLRQLYFLLGGLLDRLVYLSIGLSFVLGFIGVKLIFEALHGNDLPFINGGQPVEWAPELPIWLSLVVIVAVLAITAVASLIKSAHDHSAEDHRTPQRLAP